MFCMVIFCKMNLTGKVFINIRFQWSNTRCVNTWERTRWYRYHLRRTQCYKLLHEKLTVNRSWYIASFWEICIRRCKRTTKLTLNKNTKYLHSQPLMIQLFLSVSVAIAPNNDGKIGNWMQVVFYEINFFELLNTCVIVGFSEVKKQLIPLKDSSIYFEI